MIGHPAVLYVILAIIAVCTAAVVARKSGTFTRLGDRAGVSRRDQRLLRDGGRIEMEGTIAFAFQKLLADELGLTLVVKKSKAFSRFLICYILEYQD